MSSGLLSAFHPRHTQKRLVQERFARRQPVRSGLPIRYPLPMQNLATLPDSQTASEPDSHATHTVFNQPPPFEDVNLFTTDRPLAEALRREGAGWAEERAEAFGA